MKKNTIKTNKINFNWALVGIFFLLVALLAMIFVAIIRDKARQTARPIPSATVLDPDSSSNRNAYDPEVFELVGKILAVGDGFFQVEYESDEKPVVVSVKNDGNFFRFESAKGLVTETEIEGYKPKVGETVLLRFSVPIPVSKISSATLVADKIVVNPDMGSE